jgi:hemolysin III
MPKLKSGETVVEEIFSSITHGIGLIFALTTFIILILKFSKGSLLKSVTFGSFGFLLFFLYLSSTLYHSLSSTRANKVFKIIDHCAIYLFIAATYTPFALIVIKGVLGWGLFILIWLLTLIGIVYKSLFIEKFPKLSLALYLSMGWLAILAAGPLLRGLTLSSFFLLTLGGVLYTFGTGFFVLKRLKYNHGIWHLFVLAGSISHLLSLLGI